MHINHSMSRFFLVGLIAVLLSGCGAVVVGGAATGALIAHDRRTTGTYVEDQEIRLRAIVMRNDDPALQQNANIDISVFNLQVLLTGQATNIPIVERFRDRVLTIPRVRGVFNEVAIGAESTWGESTADAFLTAKVNLALNDIELEDFDMSRVKVTSSLGSVYLMGLVTPTEADTVTEVVRYVSGVKRVIKLFEYLDG